MLKVGLTGSIGTGKSTVLKIFKDLGAYVIDADEIVHSLYKKKYIQEKVKSKFGDVFNEDNSLNRKKVAEIIFNNPEKKKILESIIHPEVRKEINNKIKDIENKDKNAIVIVEIPLLIETGQYREYETVVVVYSPRDLQLDRLLKKGLSKEEALKRINSQMDIEEKLKYADFVIDNSSSIENLKKEVIKTFNNLKRLKKWRNYWFYLIFCICLSFLQILRL